MLRRITSAATFVAMLLHALLGCCCHDGIAAGRCASPGQETASEPATTTRACPCHAHQRAIPEFEASAEFGDEQLPLHNHPHGLCGEGRCRFLRTSDRDTEWQDSRMTVVADALATSPKLCFSGQPLLGNAAQERRSETSWGMRARMQVWRL